jgi:hypothetical protein
MVEFCDGIIIGGEILAGKGECIWRGWKRRRKMSYVFKSIKQDLTTQSL